MNKIICLLSLVVLVLISSYLAFLALDKPQSVFGGETSPQVNFTQPSPIPDSIDPWLTKLATCESRGDPSVIHYNDGKLGSHSYGEFQWKIGTADIWVEKLGLIKDWDKLEYTDKANWLLDGEFSTELTAKTIEANKGNWVLWKNCAKQIGAI